jgi:hypothetical protein
MRTSNTNLEKVYDLVDPDILAKYAVQDLAIDIIQYFCPEEFQNIDLRKKVQFLDKELNAITVGSNSMGRVADNLFQVTTYKKVKKWILIHLEVQGYGYKKGDRTFEKRMFTSYYRILDRYDKPLASIAILTDKGKNYRPNHYHSKFEGTELSFKFESYKVLDQDLKKIKASTNPFAIIIEVMYLELTKGRINDEALLRIKKEITRRVIDKKYPIKKQKALLNYIKYGLRFANSENNTIFESHLKSINQNNKNMTLEQAILKDVREKGKLEGELRGISLATNNGIIKALKQGKLSVEDIADLFEVTADFVLQIKKEHRI